MEKTHTYMSSEKIRTTLKATTHAAAPDLKSERDPLASVSGETLAEFAAVINSVIDPPARLRADDIIVRKMLLVSGGPNHYGGRFGEQELQRIAELVVDSPVLVGHRKDTLPIARVFQADVITHQGERWVRAHFYWLKKATGSDTLATNIDGGLYKECSLGFTFMRAECSECGSDIRNCAHTPGADSLGDSAVYNYREIQRVLEISLVYRGATPNTRVGASLGFAELTIDTDQRGAEKIEQGADDSDFVSNIALQRLSLLNGRGVSELTTAEILAQLHAHRGSETGAIVASADLQDDLPLLVGRSGGELFALRDDGAAAPDNLASAALALGGYPEYDFLLYGRLIGMRGKQRRSLSELAKRLNSGAGPVRSFKLRAVALLYWEGRWANADNAEEFQKQLESMCKESDRLSFAQGRNALSGRNHVPCEKVIAVGPGAFHFLRAPGNPGALCQRVGGGAPTPTLTIGESAGVNSDEFIDANDASAVVSLKFDRVKEQDGRLRFVNSRINAYLGELCGVEEYLYVKPRHAPQGVINGDTIIRLSASSGQPILVSPTKIETLTPGVCHVLTAEESISTSNIVNMSVGDVAQFQVSGGQYISARVIELVCGEKRVIALLSDEGSLDVRAL